MRVPLVPVTAIWPPFIFLWWLPNLLCEIGRDAKNESRTRGSLLVDAKLIMFCVCAIVGNRSVFVYLVLGMDLVRATVLVGLLNSHVFCQREKNV